MYFSEADRLGVNVSRLKNRLYERSKMRVCIVVYLLGGENDLQKRA